MTALRLWLARRLAPKGWHLHRDPVRVVKPTAQLSLLAPHTPTTVTLPAADPAPQPERAVEVPPGWEDDFSRGLLAAKPRGKGL